MISSPPLLQDVKQNGETSCRATRRHIIIIYYTLAHERVSFCLRLLRDTISPLSTTPLYTWLLPKSRTLSRPYTRPCVYYLITICAGSYNATRRKIVLNMYIMQPSDHVSGSIVGQPLTKKIKQFEWQAKKKNVIFSKNKTDIHIRIKYVTLKTRQLQHVARLPPPYEIFVHDKNKDYNVCVPAERVEERSWNEICIGDMGGLYGIYVYTNTPVRSGLFACARACFSLSQGFCFFFFRIFFHFIKCHGP